MIYRHTSLEADPSAPTVPGKVTLTFSVRADRPGTRVSVTCSLSPAHGFWFLTDRGLAKRVTVDSVTIDEAPTTIARSVDLRRGPGAVYPVQFFVTVVVEEPRTRHRLRTAAVITPIPGSPASAR